MTHFPRLAILSLTAAVLVAAAACGAEPITSPPARSPSAAPSAGSPTTPTPEADLAAPGTRLQSLQWDGVQRTYVVHAPPQYREGQRFPLVLVLHYLGGSGEKMRLMTKFDAKADQEGFLVVYVNGISSALNGLSCCGSSDDVGFVKALTDHMRRFWNADPNRIYATGISNGADMSFRLAVELSGTFAAIAPISGGYIGTRAEEEENLIPTSPVSVISIIGRLDGGIARFERGLAT